MVKYGKNYLIDAYIGYVSKGVFSHLLNYYNYMQFASQKYTCPVHLLGAFIFGFLLQKMVHKI